MRVNVQPRGSAVYSDTREQGRKPPTARGFLPLHGVSPFVLSDNHDWISKMGLVSLSCHDVQFFSFIVRLRVL